MAYVDGRKHDNISFRKIILLLHPYVDVPYSFLHNLSFDDKLLHFYKFKISRCCQQAWTMSRVSAGLSLIG